MSPRPTKTDNKSIANKIFIRKEAIKSLKEIKVLDLFAGRNVLWNNIHTDKYFGIDIEANKGKNLNADTRLAIDNLNLGEFNVIDCDSYGIAFDLYKKLLTRKDIDNGTIQEIEEEIAEKKRKEEERNAREELNRSKYYWSK